MNIRKLLNYFAYLMVLVYLGAGTVLLLPGIEISSLNRSTRIVLGIALILYGMFRAWRVIKTNNNEKAD